MCVCVDYHLICVLAELSFYLCGHMHLCAFPPHISIKHILICIRLYEHPSSSVHCTCVWVFVVRAHLSERSQDMASGLLGVLGTIF